MPVGGGGSGTAGMLAYRRRSKPIPGVGIDLSHPLSQGLVQYWAFNEGSVQSARDLVNGYTVATIGSVPPTVGSGVDGPCLSFSNVSSCYITTTTALSLPRWTLAVRVKINASHVYQSLLVTGAATFGLYIKTLSPDMYFGADHLASASLTAGVWSTVVVTYDGAIVSYFVDGVAAGSFGWGSGAWNSAANKIGSTTASNPLDGSIGWMAMWNRALSPTEVESVTVNPWQCCLPLSPQFINQAAAFSATGTMSASRHPTVSSSGTQTIPTYTGTSSVSRHPTIASSGTRTAPAYTGTSSVSRHPTITATTVPTYTGSATLTTSHPTIPLSATPTAWWKMDSISGSTAPDATGSSPATISGSVTQSASVPTVSFADAGSYSFNGGMLSTSVAMPASWTITFWTKLTTQPITPHTNLGANGSGNGIYTSGSGLAYLSGATYLSGGLTMTAGPWQHITVTYSGGTVSFFLNGTLSGSVGGASAMGTLTNIGSDAAGDAYNGLIDDYRIYSSVLSNSQIASLGAGNELPTQATGTFTIAFTGTATVSRHPTIASSGTRTAPAYTGTSSVSRHPTITTTTVSTYTGSATLTTSHPTIPLSATPTAWWKMDSISGSTAPDAMGSSPATISGSVTQSASVPTVSFADAGSYSITGGGMLSMSVTMPTSWTISFWMKPTTLPLVPHNNLGANGYGNGIYTSGAGLAYLSGASYLTTGANLTVGVWQHVAITYSGGAVSFFVNGTPSGTANGASAMGTLANIGSDANADNYNGLLDDYRVYSSVLSNSQISLLGSGKELPTQATGTFAITFTGTSAISRHPTIASSGTRTAPAYTGTCTVSRHPTESSSGQFVVVYRGTSSVSCHPTISASGTQSVPTYTGTSSVSLHPSFTSMTTADVFTGQATLTIGHPTIAAHGSMAQPASQTLNLFAAADTVPTHAGSITLFAAGHSAGTTGGLLSTVMLYAAGWDNPPYTQLNMYASGYVPPQVTSGVMNMYTAGGHPSLWGSVPLYTENAYGSASSDVLMYAAGQGITPGALPASATLNMFVQRGTQDGVFMYAENKGVAGSVDLFARGSPQATGQVQMFASGYGGTLAGTVMMATPDVTQPTPASGQVTLAAPKVIDIASGSTYLYAHGWTP